MGEAKNAGTVVRLKDGRTRRFRSKQERRQIVEETLKQGASLSLVARAHDVNTNQVFKWRKQYRAGFQELTARKDSPILRDWRHSHRHRSAAAWPSLVRHTGPVLRRRQHQFCPS